MGSGFFLGGAASGMNTAEDNARQEQRLGLETRNVDLRQQGLDFEQKQKLLATADQHVADTMAIIANTIQQGKQAGRDPESIMKAVQPLLQDAGAIYQKTGRDPGALQNKAAALLAAPSPEALAAGEGKAQAAKEGASGGAYKFQQIGEDAMGGKQYGFVNPKTQHVVPAKVGGQPNQQGAQADPNAAGDPNTLPQQAMPAQAAEPGVQPRNEAFITSMPAEIQPTIKQLVDYEIKPTDLSIRGNQRQKMLAAAKLYDPEYDSMLAPARQKAINEFAAGGNTSPASQITQGNTAILHANEMGAAAEEMKNLPGGLSRIANSGTPFVSYAAAQLKNKMVQGTPEGKALQEFMVAKQHFSEEVTKFYSGSQGSEAERERALQNLDQAKSLTEIRAAIAQEAKLMADKVSALQDRFKNANGPRAWMAAIKRAGGDFPIIQDQAKSAIQQINSRMGGGAKESSASVPTPAATDTGVINFDQYFGKQ